jgi:tRNA(Arg) A34 adenosine deaminase TadA
MRSSIAIEKIRERLRTYVANDPAYPDDEIAIACIEEAADAVNEGNFGIGCTLLDAEQKIVARGHNQVFTPHFRSDAHGEMVVMNAFEEAHHKISSMRGYTLYTSLESCPMCMARLIMSGCENVLHVADDLTGMVHLAGQLPPVWQSLLAPPRQKWARAQCHPSLLANGDELVAKLRTR